ncbi:hypothetical protein RHMOL_Rhmol03G0234800 [Rhododendron molle]|uniref:Uncharacterized protein n=1 Tax=Rhododendron molle TaxID=49168 RepID=A0ACC0PHX1_RHOML|nr:hypothetical protein RHMOL_Rhmol03G0234800 [Rhododendron molle]
MLPLFCSHIITFHLLKSDELDKIDRAQSSFWRDWKQKLEEQKRVADHSRVLEQIIPGVETMRFLSRDMNYIESVVFSHVESVKLEKKHILKDMLKLANTYGLNHTKVLLRFLYSVLVSEVWALDDITAEISEFKNEILAHAGEAIETISLSVYPAIDGHDKQRLAYLYGLLSDCYLQLEGTTKLVPMFHPTLAHINVDFAHFYKVVEQECSRLSFIKDLNFKNIVGLGGLNYEFFTNEIYAHIDEYTVEALATTVQALIGMYRHPIPEDLISWKDVYRHHVLCLLKALEERVKMQAEFESQENLHALISELEKTYDGCRKYVRVMAYPDVLYMFKRFFTVIAPLHRLFEGTSSDSTWRDCLIFLSNFWLRVIDDMKEFTSRESPQEKSILDSLMCCVKVFTRLVIEGRISPKQGWGTFIGYVINGFKGGFADDIITFCRAMGFSGCGFGAIAEVYSEAVSQWQIGSSLDTERHFESIQDLSHLYLSMLETILQNLASGSLERQNLLHFMSSLSRMDGDLEDLNRVRQAVWERMAKFCDNLILPSHVRVYALELMQFISDSGRNASMFSAELKSNVLPWEGWYDSRSIATKSEGTATFGIPTQTDASNRLTSTLVALKSSQLVLAISPSIEISPQDLSTVDSAVSCFMRLCGEAASEPHFDALLAILGEWEGLFAIKRDEADSAEVSDGANDWGNDDWEEGWESFPEEPVSKETKEDNSLLVHPLHVCWLEIFRKLISLSRFRDLFKLVDRSVVKSNGVLLDQVGAHSLTQILLEIDCFVALKMALLFPYEELRLQCLDAVEDKLKQGGVSDVIVRDHEFFILVLCSGIVSPIISGSKYGTTFSLLSYMIGNFSRQYQEAQLSSIKSKGRNENDERGFLILFGRYLFPCFVSELVKADQQILAGFLVTKFMHTNASLSLINVAESSLRLFLQRQLQVLKGDDEGVGFGEPFGNTISQLRVRNWEEDGGIAGRFVYEDLLFVGSPEPCNCSTRRWKALAADNNLWLNLCEERWGSICAAFYAPKDSRSWKDVYEVQDRRDRVGLDQKIIREGVDYYLVHLGEVHRHLGSRPQSKGANGCLLGSEIGLKEEPSSRILDKILFFLGDLEAASVCGKRKREV